MTKLTYSNVVATLALFLAIGGVSYAAVSLAPNSVGTVQLRSGSITGSKLAFPLGMATSEAAGPVTLEASPCSAQTPCAPSLPAPLTSATLNLPRPSRALLIASGQFNLPDPSKSSSVAIGLQIGQQRLPSGSLPVTSALATPLSIERVVTLPAGRQTIALTATMNPSSAPVSAFALQLVAVVLPASAGSHPTKPSTTERPLPVSAPTPRGG